MESAGYVQFLSRVINYTPQIVVGILRTTTIIKIYQYIMMKDSTWKATEGCFSLPVAA